MRQLQMLNKQHKGIYELINEIKRLTNESVNKNANTIAMKINKLAGILKIHLSSEDKYMYPSLMNNKDEKVSYIAQDFVKEMGGLSETFKDYKTQFNTVTKIVNNIDDFKIHTNTVLTKLQERLTREDTQLYQMIEKI
ncbi:hemerythrin HHE cation binding domain-containing protein [Natranaerovirga hydrolytica]|uniref:Hemerythrin HHE cation binding domain-containing protein n=1 Tax=Natranaerovirga hydrolytica TaxID=680378 RepID=A0A4R1MFJ9_9FIRM|nr:hemerythrin domain-containing protein [Natranaerovirga hydrolytica]TCK90512.1 hemerythrin HHE cation binding domain-containing protein [Natranaerovirga hydrolytica]